MSLGRDTHTCPLAETHMSIGRDTHIPAQLVLIALLAFKYIRTQLGLAALPVGRDTYILDHLDLSLTCAFKLWEKEGTLSVVMKPRHKEMKTQVK